ncbi:WYL domain-containing protein [Streptococcus gordonii]|uniref:helix-turn-helix transcriptional regulator n=1 Tax=Streptococcus gordonii TaxID=1302 RepID=UPI000DA32579|nr:WYL domain-containing protein [Streptococcus gordonii]QXA19136.1 WYL domain-containing protein [Streptococcus gordonii]SQG04833.1 putative transcriptional regulator [Streptococcus gordonii]
MNDQERILSILLRLQAGARLSKNQLSDEFGVSAKTIQRDFALLGDFLMTQPMIAAELAYDSKHHTRYLKGKSLFNKKDILIISKILLENRALNKVENEDLLKSLLGLVSKEEQKEIEMIINSERLNYAPITDEQNRIQKIWEWSEMIRKEKVLEIVYKSPYQDKKEHLIFPVSLYYDSHYFYLVVYQLKHETYITLRVDRIQSWDPSNIEKPSISYRDKFRDGDIRNERVDAFIGKKISVEIEYLYDPTIVMDQFPNAKIVGKNEGWTRFKFESQYTPGLKRWLLSQGEAVKILSPQSLVDDIRKTMKEILDYYQ